MTARPATADRPVTDLLLPTTDAGVAAQLAVLAAAAAVALRLAWSQHALRLLVFGVALTLLGLLGLRAAH